MTYYLAGEAGGCADAFCGLVFALICFGVVLRILRKHRHVRITWWNQGRW